MRLRLALEVIGVILAAVGLGLVIAWGASLTVVGVWLVYVARGE